MRRWRAGRGLRQPQTAAPRVACEGPSGYVIADDGRSISFWPCGVTSYNTKDIENLYCARCHRFVRDLSWRDDQAPADRQ